MEIAPSPSALRDYRDRALFDFGAIAGGYGWIFGKQENLSCGVGVFGRGDAHDLRPALARFLASHPALREARILHQQGHRIPLAGGRQTRVNGHVLLAGDAAAVADPLTGEGIPYAVTTGQRAGAAVLAALADGSRSLAAYDDFVGRTLWADLPYARILSSRLPLAELHVAAGARQYRIP